ncbi:MAG: hypothetical protein NC121_10265 [Blautia sp.]|nr:hypothetical protein [Blautia sp.]
MSAYLFVHFKEKRTPDGEQVYFGISRDSFHWDAVNGGSPVLWRYEGDRGVRDFETFTAPRMLYRREDGGSVIDSAMYEEDGVYYCFLKSEGDPAHVILVRSEHVTGPFTKVESFDKCMESLEPGMYEAPTAFVTADGRWCLLLDYYGCGAEGQGYVPFLADSLKSGVFVRSDESFSFPYGFKHGTVLAITDEEYGRLKGYRKPPDER